MAREGVRHDGAGLYQYSINMKYKQMAWAWKGRSEPVHTVRFGFVLPSVTKETERALKTPRNVIEREKNVKSRDRMLNDKEIFVLQTNRCCIWLNVTAIPNSADYLQSIYYHITLHSIVLFV